MRLLATVDPEEIGGIIDDYVGEQRLIQRNIHTLMLSMRGALTREDAWNLSHDERRDLLNLLEERAKASQKAAG